MSLYQCRSGHKTQQAVQDVDALSYMTSENHNIARKRVNFMLLYTPPPPPAKLWGVNWFHRGCLSVEKWFEHDNFHCLLTYNDETSHK